ncbi:MAG TPA: hypothetical protein VGN82_03410 [Bosea sp. (in: a-proteobacteria)]|jgi:hypothetical protein|uniref:hypothetical protein n=1 Tax=Bosea sp. (in: a-proteobacteria) TaxID=1871050 RepID=UPI002E0F9CE6|nr:hypothetical protein [Bosea sp. (in: a-proteobacteria)]
MSLSAKALERLLDKTEFDLVARTRRGKLADEKDEQLRDLARTLRDRRDKARTVARQQRREFRGKVPPQGTRPASDNTGTKAKADALTVALKRVGAEQTRRAEKLRAPSQRSIARKALALKQRQSAAERPKSRTADKGMKSLPTRKTAKSGALDHAGQRSAMHRSKFAR